MASRRRSYVRRRRTRKSYGRKLRRGTPRRKLSIGRRLAKLERAARAVSTIVNTRVNFVSAMSAPYLIIPLSNYSVQQPVFGSVPGEAFEKSHAYHQSVGMDIRVRMNNEYDKVTYTMFIVSLKDQAAPILNPATGLPALTAGDHFSSSSSMVMVNKEFFNIHKIKRFATGNNSVQPNFAALNYGFASNEPGEQGLRREHRFYMKQRFAHKVHNPIGAWSALVGNPDPSKNYYILLFNDNSLADLTSPEIEVNFIHTYKVYG